MTIKKTKFSYKDEIILIETKNLSMEHIDTLKRLLAMRLMCDVDEINVDVEDEHRELSDIDINYNGLFDWKSLYPKYFKGVRTTLVEGSDQHLDSILDGTIDSYLDFF